MEIKAWQKELKTGHWSLDCDKASTLTSNNAINKLSDVSIRDMNTKFFNSQELIL